MRSTKAVFKKQFKGSVQNPEILIQFMIFPLMAFMMNIFVDMEGMASDLMIYAPHMAEEMLASMPNVVTMMAAVFAGMALIPTVAGIIAEDIEKKSLRFLIMAGVKPPAYLLGVGSVIFMVSVLTALAFAFVGGFGGMDFVIFIGALLSGVTASIMLGAAIGILTGNQQSATALAMPVAMILGFGPMIAQFNDSVARVLRPLYSQQLNVIVDYINLGTDVSLWQSFGIIWANVLVMAVLFMVVYVRTGIKG